MKNLNKLVIALLLTLSLGAHASTLKVESVILNDDSVVNSNEISAIHIDYIDLSEGSRIESSDIKKIILKNHLKGDSSRPGLEFNAAIKIGGGDGSGG